MKRKRIILGIVLILIASVLGAQDRLILVSGGYVENHHSYNYESGNLIGLPNSDFTDTWRSWGLGSTQFMQGSGKAGFYNSTLLFFPEKLIRNPGSSAEVKEFRIGLNTISGIGAFLGSGRFGILLGGGLHTDFAFFNKYPGTSDSNYFFFNIGLGGGAHLHFAINEKIGIHVGTAWWWDPFQVRSSSANAISNAYTFGTGWGYNVTAGISFKVPAHNGRGLF